jgi:hypothetical protein
MKSAAMILAMEILGAAAVSVGAGLIFPPAGVIAAGIFLLVFAIAVERSRAQ